MKVRIYKAGGGVGKFISKLNRFLPTAQKGAQVDQIKKLKQDIKYMLDDKNQSKSTVIFQLVQNGFDYNQAIDLVDTVNDEIEEEYYSKKNRQDEDSESMLDSETIPNEEEEDREEERERQKRKESTQRMVEDIDNTSMDAAEEDADDDEYLDEVLSEGSAYDDLPEAAFGMEVGNKKIEWPGMYSDLYSFKNGGAPNKNKFIKATVKKLKKAQQGMQKEPSPSEMPNPYGTLDNPLGKDLTPNKSVVSAIKNTAQNFLNEEALKKQAEQMYNQQYMRPMNMPNAAQGGANDWATNLHNYGEALSHQMPNMGMNTTNTNFSGEQMAFGGANRRVRRANKAFFGTPIAPPGAKTDYQFGPLGGLRRGQVQYDLGQIGELLKVNPNLVNMLMPRIAMGMPSGGFWNRWTSNAPGFNFGQSFGSSYGSSYSYGTPKTRLKWATETVNNAADPSQNEESVMLNNNSTKPPGETVAAEWAKPKSGEISYNAATSWGNEYDRLKNLDRNSPEYKNMYPSKEDELRGKVRGVNYLSSGKEDDPNTPLIDESRILSGPNTVEDLNFATNIMQSNSAGLTQDQLNNVIPLDAQSYLAVDPYTGYEYSVQNFSRPYTNEDAIDYNFKPKPKSLSILHEAMSTPLDGIDSRETTPRFALTDDQTKYFPIGGAIDTSNMAPGVLQKFAYGGKDYLRDGGMPRFAPGGAPYDMNVKDPAGRNYQQYIDWYNETPVDKGMSRAAPQSYAEWKAENNPQSTNTLTNTSYNTTNRTNTQPGNQGQFQWTNRQGTPVVGMGPANQNFGSMLSRMLGINKDFNYTTSPQGQITREMISQMIQGNNPTGKLTETKFKDRGKWWNPYDNKSVTEWTIGDGAPGANAPGSTDKDSGGLFGKPSNIPQSEWDALSPKAKMAIRQGERKKARNPMAEDEMDAAASSTTPNAPGASSSTQPDASTQPAASSTSPSGPPINTAGPMNTGENTGIDQTPEDFQYNQPAMDYMRQSLSLGQGQGAPKSAGSFSPQQEMGASSSEPFRIYKPGETPFDLPQSPSVPQLINPNQQQEPTPTAPFNTAGPVNIMDEGMAYGGYVPAYMAYGGYMPDYGYGGYYPDGGSTVVGPNPDFAGTQQNFFSQDSDNNKIPDYLEVKGDQPDQNAPTKYRLEEQSAYTWDPKKTAQSTDLALRGVTEGANMINFAKSREKENPKYMYAKDIDRQVLSKGITDIYGVDKKAGYEAGRTYIGKYGGSKFAKGGSSYTKGKVYSLTMDEINEIKSRGGSVKFV